MSQRTVEPNVVVLVAGSGGHLTQMRTLSGRIAANRNIVWVTDRTTQSESLLTDDEVIFLPYRAPRNALGTVMNGFLLHKELRSRNVDAFYSTGAGIALSCILPAILRRSRLVYIESATRVTGLSLTGRILNLIPTVKRYVQYPHAQNARWKFAISVFDGYAVKRIDTSMSHSAPLSVLVTVGANQQTGFRRLIDELGKVIPSNANVFWQYGPTDVSDLRLNGAPTISSDEMARRMAAADVVISHAGTGSTLMALQNGSRPIVVPRRHSHGEHVDDHQSDLAAFLHDRGLAMVREVGAITVEDLYEASNYSVHIETDLEAVQLLPANP